MKVTIVGNSADILVRKNGALIDKSDRIVRINSFRLDGIECHSGTIIDIVSITLAREVLTGALPHSAELIRKGREIWTPTFTRTSIDEAEPLINCYLGLKPSRIKTATEIGASEALQLAYSTGQQALDRSISQGGLDDHVKTFGRSFLPTTGFLTIFIASQVFAGWDLAITGFGLNGPLSPHRCDSSGAGMWKGHCLAVEREILLDGIKRGSWQAI